MSDSADLQTASLATCRRIEVDTQQQMRTRTDTYKAGGHLTCIEAGMVSVGEGDDKAALLMHQPVHWDSPRLQDTKSGSIMDSRHSQEALHSIDMGAVSKHRAPHRHLPQPRLSAPSLAEMRHKQDSADHCVHQQTWETCTARPCDIRFKPASI